VTDYIFYVVCSIIGLEIALEGLGAREGAAFTRELLRGGTGAAVAASLALAGTGSDTLSRSATRSPADHGN
jgi:hypothetical protein